MPIAGPRSRANEPGRCPGASVEGGAGPVPRGSEGSGISPGTCRPPGENSAASAGRARPPRCSRTRRRSPRSRAEPSPEAGTSRTSPCPRPSPGSDRAGSALFASGVYILRGVSSLSALAAVTPFVATLALTPLVRTGARRWGLLDRPNPRSSHSQVIPRGGGMALLVAVGLSLALAPALWSQRPAAAALLVGALVLAVVGLCDDRFGLPPLARLGVQFVVATGFVSCAGGIDRLPLPPPLDMPLDPLGTTVSVLWIVAVANFYNFMYGIDGLAGLQTLITGAGIAVAGFEPLAFYLRTALAGGAACLLVLYSSAAGTL